jgi:hypothetical protein
MTLMTRPPIRAITVVVPAHNEQDLLGACLESLRRAAERVSVPVRVVVVLDRCTDDSAAICAQHGVATVSIDDANVGRARAAGFAVALKGADAATWLASTDADTTVPPDWFARQLAIAARGADAIVGVVEVTDWADFPAAGRARYEAQYELDTSQSGRTHPHVHGANLGVRADAYLAAGGYPPLAAHEDHALVRALEALPAVAVVRTTEVVVTTSSRTLARAPQGFGALLHELAGTETSVDATNAGAASPYENAHENVVSGRMP